MTAKVFSIYPPTSPLVAAEISRGEGFAYLTPDEASLDELLQKFRVLLPNYDVFAFPEFDCLPYDRASPSQEILARRMDVLLRLGEKSTKPFCVILSAGNFLKRVPSPKYFEKTALKVSMGDLIDRELLLTALHDQGFSRVETVYETGDYAVRGSIIDIFPATSPHPVRLDFLGDEVESLRLFDIATQKTTSEVLEITLQSVSELLLNEKTISHFRTAFRAHAHGEHPLYHAISEGRTYPGMEHFIPLFYEEMVPLSTYFSGIKIIREEGCDKSVEEALIRIHTYFDERCHTGVGERPYYPLPPKILYLGEEEWEGLSASMTALTSLDHMSESPEYMTKPLAGIPPQPFDEMGLLDIAKMAAGKILCIGCENKGRAERVVRSFHDIQKSAHHVQNLPSQKGIHALVFPIKEAFVFEDYIFIPASFFLGERQKPKSQKTTNIDRFFKELNTYNIGDFLVHRDHGVGKYLGLQTIHVDRTQHDCITLEYADQAKLFLPVEHMEVLTHFSKEGTPTEPDRLGSASWQNKKARVKKKLFEIAEYLLKIAAERYLKTAQSIHIEPSVYEKFCAGFPYIETEDQARVIAEVEQDLAKAQPMDRLVCGDVGFGKTEIALRAAFLGIQSGLQVIVIVPTTLLARQHFATFQQRFKGFGARIEMLCRLVPSKKAEDIRYDIETGSVNILIATHAAFSDKLKPANLGLLIVDEEQHFGVKQKEKIKTMKGDVHVLTLSATPIPRTLQMSLAGIRELSLITTPPVDRIPVKTFVLEQDFTLLRDVILREYQRGGQVFFVSPRLEDLDQLFEKIAHVIPEVKVGIAHGQMKPTQLEDVVQDFYDHKYDILLSTNIIESGIDVPNANTLIVHKAHLFGLAQLYQIRGRIGRGKKQGYAYLTVPFEHALTELALKRLKVLQSLDHLGAGFTLASHDLDMRGAGNLVGEEQSGHIKEVGVELYQHMLQEAILSVRAKQTKEEVVRGDFTPTINLGTSVLIPESYVADLSLRLGLYKRIALLTTTFDMDQFKSEMMDRFGKIPEEMQNLLNIVLIKQYCLKAGIEKVDAGEKGIVISFHKNTFKNPGELLDFIQKQGGKLKLRPDHKLVFMGELKNLERRASVAEKLTRALAKMVEAD